MVGTANMLTVPATRGKMGTSTYYTANFPMAMVTRLFQYDPDEMAELEPEDRRQRQLKKARIPEIANYMLDNDDYLFASITVSVDAEHLGFRESEMDTNVGLLSLPMEVGWFVNDGQHRVAGIAAALKSDPRFRQDNLSVVILPDGGLERSQQIFSDLNRTVQKTSKSLGILYDHREPINRITNECVELVPLFRGRTNKERASLSARSTDFTTLATVQAANVQLLGVLPTSLPDIDYAQKLDLAVEYWKFVTGIVEPWETVATDGLNAAEARADYLSSYALAIWAIGNVGQTVVEISDWKVRLSGLSSVNWLKSNSEWEGICMQDGTVITRGPTRTATANLLKWKLDLGDEPERLEF